MSLKNPEEIQQLNSYMLFRTSEKEKDQNLQNHLNQIIYCNIILKKKIKKLISKRATQ